MPESPSAMGLACGEKAIAEIVVVTHARMTTTEFERIVKDRIATAKHPKTVRLERDISARQVTWSKRG